MRSESSCPAISLPDVHLDAAAPVAPGAAVDVALAGLPVEKIGLPVYELDIVGALGIAVASTVSGASLVIGKTCAATIRVHLYKVQSAVEAAWKLADIDIEGEFGVLQTEHLVRVVILQEVNSRANIRPVLALSYESKVQLVARGGHPIRVSIFARRSLQHTVVGARLWIGTERVAPFVPAVTVFVSRSFVEPSPVGVDGH